MYVSSHFGALGGADGMARWVGAGTFTADQWSKASVETLTNQGGGQGGLGVIVRASADVNPNYDMYLAVVDSDAGSGGTHTIALAKIVNGALTVLSSTTSVVTNGDTVELEAEGTAIRMYLNGVEKLSATDGDIASGQPGVLCLSNSGSGNYGDNWEGGNMTPTEADAGRVANYSIRPRAFAPGVDR